MNINRVFAVDPSLTCSGWALFSLVDSKLLGIGKVKSLSPKYQLNYRLNDLQNKIQAVFDLTALDQNDVLICEDATSNLDPSAASKVEQVRGIFETLARTRQVQVLGRLHPRTVQHELMGLKGKQLTRTTVKATACDIVNKLYSKHLSAIGFDCSGENLKNNQDIVDAMLIGNLAVTKLQQVFKTGGLPSECFMRMGNRFSKHSNLTRRF